ncbi:hypothetical protein LWI28_017772 [Acer negundo]|uniref:WAT1-related protein n=1 Tax=Acer negundo TaxID=4023 RepID=A0AAD5IAT3_ACENE|nr:hypothetical protein LWI28_017772 [Acer negundo]
MDSFEVVKKWMAWSEVFISMIMVQVFATGMQLLSKLILSQGTFIFALLTYRHVVAALCVSPFAFFFERIEKLKLDTIEGKFKTLGAILCVGGALATSLYKGKDIIHFGHPKIHHNSSSTITVNISHRHHWTRGTFMLVGSVMSYASWYMVQGALATAATFCLITRVIPKRGPTYPPMFNPLALIFTAFFEAFIFGQAITLGSLLGSFFIIVGLYAFLWAKKKEYKKFQAEAQAKAQAQANVQVTVVGDEGSSRVNSTIIPTY